MNMSTIEEVVIALEEMMSGHGNAIEQMSRSGKGELFILRFLSNKNVAVLPSEISDAMHSSNARISAALGSLEKKGQIHREIDTTNRRNILVTITEEGRERIRLNMEKMRERMVCVLTEMGEHDAAEFVRLIKSFFEISSRVFCEGVVTKLSDSNRKSHNIFTES